MSFWLVLSLSTQHSSTNNALTSCNTTTLTQNTNVYSTNKYYLHRAKAEKRQDVVGGWWCWWCWRARQRKRNQLLYSESPFSLWCGIEGALPCLIPLYSWFSVRTWLRTCACRWRLVGWSCSLGGALHVDGGDGGHEAALEQAVRVGGLVVTVQLPPHKVFPEALGPRRGAHMTRSRSLWTCGTDEREGKKKRLVSLFFVIFWCLKLFLCKDLI